MIHYFEFQGAIQRSFCIENIFHLAYSINQVVIYFGSILDLF